MAKYMTQYINKSALMAEIERRIQFFTEEPRSSNSDIVISLLGLKSFIDTLEVKEADFDEEFNKYHIGLYNPFNSGAEIYGFAKHFFELGLNAQKEE